MVFCFRRVNTATCKDIGSEIIMAMFFSILFVHSVLIATLNSFDAFGNAKRKTFTSLSGFEIDIITGRITFSERLVFIILHSALGMLVPLYWITSGILTLAVLGIRSIF